MLQSISDIFSKKEDRVFDGDDVKRISEGWLQRELQNSSVYCTDVVGETLNVRVGSPVLYQEVILRGKDLQQEIQKEYNYVISTINVEASYY